MTKLLYKNLTYAIIGACMEAHRVLGPGFLESVYQTALANELALRGIPFHEQVRLQVTYKEIIAGEYRADFLIDDKVIVEIKAVSELNEIHEAQLINYLKGTDYRVGLLINFGASSLEHERRVV
ncbi:MAG: GxxExxY protein [Chloroflexota bacterium]|nr:GxxExxY protein [Chloroflexota bacterium]